jgi:hypothetical protein
VKYLIGKGAKLEYVSEDGSRGLGWKLLSGIPDF